MISSINANPAITAQPNVNFKGAQPKVTLQNASDSFKRADAPAQPKEKTQWGKVAGLIVGAAALWIAAFHGKEAMAKIKEFLPKKVG